MDVHKFADHYFYSFPPNFRLNLQLQFKTQDLYVLQVLLQPVTAPSAAGTGIAQSLQ
jgi:hypothetical protein